MNNSVNPSQVIQEVIRSKRVDGVFLQTTELVWVQPRMAAIRSRFRPVRRIPFHTKKRKKQSPEGIGSTSPRQERRIKKSVSRPLIRCSEPWKGSDHNIIARRGHNYQDPPPTYKSSEESWVRRECMQWLWSMQARWLEDVGSTSLVPKAVAPLRVKDHSLTEQA